MLMFCFAASRWERACAPWIQRGLCEIKKCVALHQKSHSYMWQRTTKATMKLKQKPCTKLATHALLCHRRYLHANKNANIWHCAHRASVGLVSWQVISSTDNVPFETTRYRYPLNNKVPLEMTRLLITTKFMLTTCTCCPTACTCLCDMSMRFLAESTTHPTSDGQTACKN